MYYYNNELPPQQGWICPKCGRVNAPWLPTCGCVSSQTTGTASGPPYLVGISSISRDSHEITKDETNSSVFPNNFDKDINVRSKTKPQTDGILFKGNLKEGDYKLTKTTDGWVLEGEDIVYCGWERSSE